MAPASTSARICGARKAVIQSRPAGLTVSSMRAAVIMPRSPTSTRRSSLKRALSLATWLASVEGSPILPSNTSTATGQPSAVHMSPIDDLQLAGPAVAVVAESRQLAGAPLEISRGDVIKHERAVLEMPTRQLRLDPFLLPDQPVERFIQRLLVDRAELQHRPQR